MALTYAAAVEALEGAVAFGIHPSLDGIRALTDSLGRPQDSLTFVQVTGTNGKTSVARMVAALLGAAGLRTGCYTSPHLESYTERMEIGGRPVSEVDFARAVDAALEAGRSLPDAARPTEFELLTAAALWLFREHGCDWAVLEVGMGGRWDATSVVSPAVAVVTGVGLDHTERLGSTVAEIAADKAHIIRLGSSVVLGPGTAATADVFLGRAVGFGLQPRSVAEEAAASPVPEERTVRFSVTPRAPLPERTMRLTVEGAHARYYFAMQAPSYQAPNAATAVAAAEAALGGALDCDGLRDAFAGLKFPGRFEIVADDPPVVLDGAHNPQAAGVLAGAIAEAWEGARERPLVLLGMLADKDARGVVRALAPQAGGFAVTVPRSPRALPARDLASVVESVTGTAPRAWVDLRDLDASWVAAQAPQGVVITGSLYTVGQARAVLRPPPTATLR